MKYLLIWLVLASSGALTSGSATFDDKAACQMAGADMTILAMELDAEGRTPKVTFLYECKPASSTKPQ